MVRNMDTNRDILISGASVAGPALAYWLSRHGFRPTVVERHHACAAAGTRSTSAALLTWAC
jgi:2-polyprenyl-6-methoxyphenol hydroxylase-like FAD-dependent oxidoreductase